MESSDPILILVIAGLLAGAANFFINYLELPFPKGVSTLDEDWPKPKKLWIAVTGYLLVGIIGALLTPLLDALIGLKGYDPEKEIMVTLGYGIVFGYCTARLLTSVLDNILKRINSLEQKTQALTNAINGQNPRSRGVTDLKLGESFPAGGEIKNCGPFTAAIVRGTSEFAKLKENTNSDIIFKDEEGTGADRMMNNNLFNCLNTLATKVKSEWSDYKLRVTEAWDENNEHTENSLHYEARAADINVFNVKTSTVDNSKLGRLSGLATESGFDWVWYENKEHVHVSCKA
jgi:hypothetical protein